MPRGQAVVDDEPDRQSAQESAVVAELRQHAVVEPLRDWQVDDPQTGARLAVAEAFWPDGLQPGRGEPVVLELNPDDSDIERMQAIGYRVFTSISSPCEYVDREAALDAGESRALDGSRA